MIRSICLALVLAGCGLAQQTCTINNLTVTATGRVGTYNNTSLQCSGWRLAYYSQGFSGVSIELDGAPDNNGVPGTWAAISASGTCTLTGSNPLTATTSGTTLFTNCQFPWISINITTATGTGKIVARANGAGGIQASTIGGSGAGGITQLTGDGIAGPGSGSQAFTLATVATGATCGDATHVSQITFNSKGLVTGCTPVAISGGGGSGSLVLVEAHTASSSASLNFTTCISSTYDDYQIEFVSLLPATDNVNLWLRYSTNGGSTYDSSTNYRYASVFGGTSGGPGLDDNGGSTAGAIVLGNAIHNSVGVTGGTIQLFDPLNASFWKVALFRQTYITTTSDNYAKHGTGVYQINTAVNAFQLLFSSGAITSGVARCYGIAH